MGLFYLQPLHHKYKFRPGDCGGSFLENRRGKTALFQAFVVQYKTPGFPVQELKMSTVTVQKYKNIPTSGFPAHLVVYQSAQAIERFSHITGLSIKVIGMERA